MDCYHITGGTPLEGTYLVQGAKNSVLPVMAACILTKSVCVLEHCPDLSDVRTMAQILRDLGCHVAWEGSSLIVDTSKMSEERICEELGSKLRSSVFLLGPMLGRFGYVNVCKPGGCDIGERPVDLHISCLEALGATVDETDAGERDELVCKASRLMGTEIHLRYPSVGATENAMMAAVMAEGETRIIGGAREPEIEDLQNFLNHCGASIRGAGTEEIVIQGGAPLHGVTYEVIPDRIETGTMLIAAAVTGGQLHLKRARSTHLEAVCHLLMEMGCSMRKTDEGLWIQGPEKLRGGVRIATNPYPGFPTDMQSAFLTAMAVAEGSSTLTETVFENRFKTIDDLKNMGADIAVEGRTAVVRGVNSLQGAIVQARDLRGGASLVLAGLAAEGKTVVKNICHIDRGYDKFDIALCALGAHIERKG